MKLNNVFVIATADTAAELTCGAKALGENVTLFYTGAVESAVNSDKAYHLSSDNLLECIPTLVRAVSDAKPQLVILDSAKNSRLVAAHIAAACKTSVQADAAEIEVVNGHVQTKRMAYGGRAIKTELSSDVAVVCIGAGVFSVTETVPVASVEELVVTADSRIHVIEKREKEESGVNLSAAKRIVGVGRGLSEYSDFEMCKDFCKLLGAELGCSRPVSEEKKWLPSACYIGVSGAMVKPEVYFTIGISGQIQHAVGVTDAGTIIALDKNENAPIFKNCDYGIVGDLRKVIPLLRNLIEG